jgi:hypothetical protein
MIQHTPKAAPNDRAVADSHTGSPPPCSHFFLDPLSWMKSELEQGKLDGKFECPKCGATVGKYAWQGLRCSCSEWIVPGISLARGKVDEVRSLAAGLGPVEQQQQQQQKQKQKQRLDVNASVAGAESSQRQRVPREENL